MTMPQLQTDWAVTTAAERVALNQQRRAETTVTVTNLQPQAKDVTVSVVTDDTVRAWFTVAEPDRRLESGAASPYVVSIAVPPEAKSGEYAFQVQANESGASPDLNPT